MSGTDTAAPPRAVVAAAPVADAARLQAVCEGLVARLGEMEMPIDELRIREAGGCVGGMLVEVMLNRTLTVPLAESAAVADLCAALLDVFEDADERSVIAALHRHACAARDAGADLDVAFS